MPDDKKPADTAKLPTTKVVGVFEFNMADRALYEKALDESLVGQRSSVIVLRPSHIDPKNIEIDLSEHPSGIQFNMRSGNDGKTLILSTYNPDKQNIREFVIAHHAHESGQPMIANIKILSPDSEPKLVPLSGVTPPVIVNRMLPNDKIIGKFNEAMTDLGRKLYEDTDNGITPKDMQNRGIKLEKSRIEEQDRNLEKFRKENPDLLPEDFDFTPKKPAGITMAPMSPMSIPRADGKSTYLA